MVIDLDAGEDITCTFTNTKRGSISIQKAVLGNDGAFSFSGDLGNFAITTASGLGQRAFADQTPGSYTVALTATNGVTAVRTVANASVKPRGWPFMD